MGKMTDEQREIEKQRAIAIAEAQLDLDRGADSEPRMSIPSAIGRNAADVATFGTADEQRGLASAAGIESPMAQALTLANPFYSSLVTGLGLVNKLTDKTGKSQKTYEAQRDAARRELGEAREDRPFSSVGGAFLGAAPLMVVPGGQSSAAGPVSSAWQAAKIAFPFGFGYGFGSGEGGAVPRLVNAGKEGTISSVFGAGADLVASGGRAAIPALKQAWRGSSPTSKITDRALKVTGRGTPQTRAAAANVSAADEFGIPLTRGQATRSMDDFAFEEAARNYAKGTTAGDVLTGFDKVQKEAIDAAANRLAVKMGQGRPAGSAIEAGESIADEIQRAARAAKKGVKDAYNKARAIGASSVVPKEAIDDIGFTVRMAIEGSDVIIDDMTPRAARALEYVDDLQRMSIRNDAAVPTRALAAAGDDITIAGVSMNGIEQVRKNINRQYKASDYGSPDRRAIREIKNAFDGWLDNVLEEGLYSGSDESLSAYKAARAAHQQYVKTFQQQGKYDDVGRFIERITSPNADIAPQEMANWLYGTARVGEKGSSVRAALKMRSIFGNNSEQMITIRQGLWSRLTGMGGDSHTPKGAQRMISDITAFIDGRGAPTARAVFTREQRDAIGRFRDALKLTVTPEGVRNPSKTAFAIERAVRDAGGSLGWRDNTISRMIDFVNDVIVQGSNVAKAKGYTTMPIPRTQNRLGPSLAAGQIGAATTP